MMAFREGCQCFLVYKDTTTQKETRQINSCCLRIQIREYDCQKKREHDDRSFAVRVSLLPKTNGYSNLPGISYWLYATNKIPNEKNVCRNAYIRKAFRRNESAHVPALDEKNAVVRFSSSTFGI